MVDNNVTLIIFKILFIFLSVLMTLANFGRLHYEQNVSAMNVICQAIGITGVIVCFCMF